MKAEGKIERERKVESKKGANVVFGMLLLVIKVKRDGKEVREKTPFSRHFLRNFATALFFLPLTFSCCFCCCPNSKELLSSSLDVSQSCWKLSGRCMLLRLAAAAVAAASSLLRTSERASEQTVRQGNERV